VATDTISNHKQVDVKGILRMQMKNIGSMRARMGAVTGVLLVAGLVLAGCGGSSKLASGAGSAAVNASAGSSGSAGSSSAQPSSKSSAVSGNSNSSFCVEAVAEQAQEAKNTDAFTGDNPADLQKFEEAGQAELKQFVAKAPSQIKSAVQTIAAADDTLVAALKAANWDITKLNSSVTAQLDTPAFETAVTTVDNYLEQTCGINPTDDAS
jgi:hypothetical protein